MVCGMTGSGKTTLSDRLLSTKPYVIVIDNKHELDWRYWTITDDPKVALAGNHTIYRPAKGIAGKRAVVWLLEAIYQAGGWVVYIDEVYTLGRGSVASYPQEYIDLLTRGRSRGITVWTGTQRPRFLPVFAFTESRHLFLFELGSTIDTKHVADMYGAPDLISEAPARKHDFIYYRRDGKLMVKHRLRKDQLR